MPEDTYFVLSSSGDSPLDIEELTKEKLLENLAEGYYGEIDIHTEVPEQINGRMQGQSSNTQILIIKGTIVQPQAEQVVVSYKID